MAMDGRCRIKVLKIRYVHDDCALERVLTHRDDRQTKMSRKVGCGVMTSENST